MTIIFFGQSWDVLCDLQKRLPLELAPVHLLRALKAHERRSRTLLRVSPCKSGRPCHVNIGREAFHAATTLSLATVGAFLLANRSRSDSSMYSDPSCGLGRECRRYFGWMKELTTVRNLITLSYQTASLLATNAPEVNVGDVQLTPGSPAIPVQRKDHRAQHTPCVRTSDIKNHVWKTSLLHAKCPQRHVDPALASLTQTRSQAAILVLKLHKCVVALCVEQRNQTYRAGCSAGDLTIALGPSFSSPLVDPQPQTVFCH